LILTNIIEVKLHRFVNLCGYSIVLELMQCCCNGLQ